MGLGEEGFTRSRAKETTRARKDHACMSHGLYVPVTTRYVSRKARVVAWRTSTSDL
jgi:hypothetical protein